MTFTGWMLLNRFSSEWLPLYIYQCLHGMAPAYLAELSTTSNFVLPRCWLSTYGTCAFSVAGPLVCWNALPDYLKSSDLSLNCFRQQLKTFYFLNNNTSPSTTFSALETMLMRSTNACYLLTYLLTYIENGC